MVARAAQKKGCIGLAAALAAVLGAAAVAAAQDGEEPVVDWVAPQGCPGRDAFVAHLARYLGDSDAAAAVHIEVRVHRGDSGFHLTWRIESADVRGERALSGTDCALLVETAALTAALAIDPRAVSMTTEDPTAFLSEDDERPPELSTRPESLAKIRDTEVVRERRRGHVLGFALRAIVGVDAGSMPGLVAPCVGAAIAGRAGAWRIEFLAHSWFEQRAALDDDPDMGGDISFWAMSFRVCRNLLQGLGTWSSCAGAEAGSMAGEGFGVDLPEKGTFVWAAGTLAAAGAWRLANQLYLRTELQLASLFYRPRFVISPGNIPVHKPWWVSVRLFTGLELRFQ